jgi:hypothetical protein
MSLPGFSADVCLNNVNGRSTKPFSFIPALIGPITPAVNLAQYYKPYKSYRSYGPTCYCATPEFQTENECIFAGAAWCCDNPDGTRRCIIA